MSIKNSILSCILFFINNIFPTPSKAVWYKLYTPGIELCYAVIVKWTKVFLRCQVARSECVVVRPSGADDQRRASPATPRLRYPASPCALGQGTSSHIPTGKRLVDTRVLRNTFKMASKCFNRYSWSWLKYFSLRLLSDLKKDTFILFLHSFEFYGVFNVCFQSKLNALSRLKYCVSVRR